LHVHASTILLKQLQLIFIFPLKFWNAKCYLNEIVSSFNVKV